MTSLFADFLSSLSLLNVSLAFMGVLAGIIIGALPGLSATMAVAVLVPFTFSLNPSSALIVLGAVYTGAIFGGSWSAILINTPGTPSAVATTFDGYAMAKNGNGDLAMSISCMSSFVGGIVGVICLALFAPPLASISLAFGPTEYFWLAILGLTLISTLAEGDNIKSLIGACFGLFLSMIGISVVGGDMRLTGNISFLNSGIEIVSAMIGLFCIPVILDLTSLKGKHLTESDVPKSLRLVEAFSIMFKNKFESL
ncbi:MAG: tripartite tricarboxylate transporter permease, partial [Proteobacteria bacterium]|nr:tripartite tricarboxylate transporter permease [Pseudomonadota bacterium]